MPPARGTGRDDATRSPPCNPTTKKRTDTICCPAGTSSARRKRKRGLDGRRSSPPCNPRTPMEPHLVCFNGKTSCAKSIAEELMAIATFSVRYLDYLKPQTKRYEVLDALVPALAIRVTPPGHRSFTLYYRHHSRMRRVGLGSLPRRLAGGRAHSGHAALRTHFQRRRSGGEKKAERAHARRYGRCPLQSVQDASGEDEELDGDATIHGPRSPSGLAASPRRRREAPHRP